MARAILEVSLVEAHNHMGLPDHSSPLPLQNGHDSQIAKRDEAPSERLSGASSGAGRRAGIRTDRCDAKRRYSS